MHLMMEGRPDWCISRQRTWGVPLPLILHKTTGQLHPEIQEIMEVVAQKIEQSGIEAWYELNLTELPFSDLENYRKNGDVLDVWFESGASHFCVLKKRPELAFPADLYLEGSDQFRGWFNSSLLSSMAMSNVAPYRQVLSHGFTVDAQGRKMSKSLGNVISPDKIVKTLGADVLRLWVASTDYKSEIHVSEEILTRMSDAYRRIRNTMRFLLANLDGFDASLLVSHQELIALDAWMIDSTSKLQEEIIEAYETYQFHLIYQKIHNFCIVELGSFYLDVIKDRQYTTKANSLARRSAQTAMYYIAHAMTRWLAPILSFTAEEIWEQLPNTAQASVFLTEWITDLPTLPSNHPMGNDFWYELMQVRDNVNKALEVQRAQGVIGAPLDAEVILFAKTELFHRLNLLKNELRFVLITSSATVKMLDEKDAKAMESEIEGLWISVYPCAYEKCVRCWHHQQDVNHTPEYPGLCGRCVSNVSPNDNGETRYYA